MPRKKFSDFAYSTQWVKKRRKKQMKIFGGKCQNCGSGAELEFCHKIPNKLAGRGRGSYYRVKDVIEHPEHYKLLCNTCHYEFDNFIITVGNHIHVSV